MSPRGLSGELLLFFEEECEKLGLNSNFGTGHKLGRTFWVWSVAPATNQIQRLVEVAVYPDKVVEVLAKVVPVSFKERYRSNEQVVGIIKTGHTLNKEWLEKTVKEARIAALNNDLLEVSVSDAMPGTYRDVL